MPGLARRVGAADTLLNNEEPVLSNQKICQKCWAEASAGALVCPACGHNVLVKPDTVAATPTPADSDSDQAGTVWWSRTLMTAIGFALLLTVAWWLKGAVVGPAMKPADFTGKWVARNEREFGSFYGANAPAEVSFSFWRNGPYLEHDIPFGGPTRFDAKVQDNIVKGGTLVGDISRPVNMTLSRDRKRLTLSYTLREGLAHPDVVIHATRP